MNTKKWYQSWTVWFNIALLAVATIGELSQIIPISPQVIAYVAFVGNLLLRIKTMQPISL
jgi:hypothetical protein